MNKNPKAICRTLVSVFIGAALLVTLMPSSGFACGCSYAGGSSGGQEFAPQNQDSSKTLSQNAIVSRQQARQIATEYTRAMNPDFEVGRLNDLGGFYEAEILSTDQEIIHLLGIDKFSGQLQVLE